MNLRKSYFDGSFYPSDHKDIIKYIEQFDQINKITIDKKISAMIVPHAGYIYSGFSANLAFSQLCHIKPKRVIVIGPSHKVAFNGATISLQDEFQTPFGNLKIDHSYAKKLHDQFDLTYIESVHQEHSTEVQMPFIKYYSPDSQVIEIIYSNILPSTLSTLITHLLKESDNMVIISTDLSHFYNQEVANQLDANCLKAIEDIDLNALDKCEACGKTGVHALLLSANTLNLHSLLIDYRTSAWASGENSRVVGYTSAAFF